MAAYNRGSSGISSDMAYQFQNNFYDLYLNNETSRYIFRIIAFKEIFENLGTYFDVTKWGKQYSVPETTEVQVGKTDNLAAWAASKGYTYLEVRTLNPRIRKNSLPEGWWTLKVYKRQEVQLCCIIARGYLIQIVLPLFFQFVCAALQDVLRVK